jgi:LmbE family N-acetylglucosaminyl deacetylase
MKPDARVLIVAAHPDDEAIGVGGQLAGFRDPYLVHVTDGAPLGHPDRTGYAAARRRELHAALAVAGVAPDRVWALGVVDQEATKHMPELAHEIAKIIERLAPETILTHAYEGGHPDHDAAAFAVHAAAKLVARRGKPAPALAEFTSYHNGNPGGSGSWMRVGEFLAAPGCELRTLALSWEARERKRRMFDCFSSQRHMLDQFPIAIERIRTAPAYEFTQPALDGRLFYEDQNWGWQGAEWRGRAREALEELG